MLKRIVQAAPPGAVRRLGRLQFSAPMLAPLILWGAARIRRGESVIQHGIGKGLKFDPAGGNPGYALGTSDLAEQDALAGVLKEGGTFYDIGAYVGFFAILGARLVGPSGRVYAFEPFPASAQAVRDNARRNGFGHVEVVQSAVSNCPGALSLVTDRGAVEHRLANSRIAGAPAAQQSIDVDVVAIDEVVSAGKTVPPNVVMIDVEGSELEVLAGMRETIRAHRPVIVCEVHWLGGAFVEAASRLSAELGYRITQLDGSSIPVVPERFHALMTPTD